MKLFPNFLDSTKVSVQNVIESLLNSKRSVAEVCFNVFSKAQIMANWESILITDYSYKGSWRGLKTCFHYGSNCMAL